MPLDRMDAGWRWHYVEQASRGVAGDACVFCALANGPVDVSTGVVDVTDRSFVVLNAFPYGSGHLLVLPRRHAARLEELDDAESVDLWRTTTRALAILGAAYAPDGANLGANLGRAAGAGIPDHVHLHVLPRWSGDTNFMTSIGETRVLPESLEESFAKIHAAYGRA